jgi:hypothetical protein
MSQAGARPAQRSAPAERKLKRPEQTSYRVHAATLSKIVPTGMHPMVVLVR